MIAPPVDNPPGRPRRAANRLVDALLEASVVGGFGRLGYLARRRLADWSEPPEGALRGLVALVTGASAGIGESVATSLARLGATVWLTGRDEHRTATVAARIRAQFPGAQAHPVIVDLADLAQVRCLADRLSAETDRLDLLIHNAGALADKYQLTVDGLEVTTQTHVVAPFLLTWSLLSKLRATPGAQVITVTSGGMYARRLDLAALSPSAAGFDGVAQYARCKRAQVVLNREWARRPAGVGIAFSVTHPGWVDTPGLRSALPRFRRLLGPLLRSPAEGADTILWLATSEAAQSRSGRLWHDRRRRSSHRLPWTLNSASAAAELWDWAAAQAVAPVVRP